MANRKPLSKKIRFEVFKRDKFTCQYCGRMSPDVILEVDHITPVAEGGNNGLLNLITSCRDCNRGKGKTLLNDHTEVKLQQDRLKELADKKEQFEMLTKWKAELVELETQQVDAICDYIASITYFSCNECGKTFVRNLLRRFTFEEVYDATEISFSRYYVGDENSWNKALNKIGGVAYNRKNKINAWDKK